MSAGVNEKILRDRILSLSKSKVWETARGEWALEQISMCSMRGAHECLCTHFPIVELCHLTNHQTGASAIVGNVCVQRFLGIPSAVLFRGFKRIAQNPGKAPSAEVIGYAFTRDWIDTEERDFLERTLRKRRLSAADMMTRMRLSNRLASYARQTEREVQTKLGDARAAAEGVSR